MSRANAFLVHLSLSTAVLGATFAVVFFVWYPQPYFEVVGAWYLIRILFFVAIVLGPLLTLIIFKPGKWGLKFDLWFIAFVQVASLVYGTAIIYEQRPYFLVFSVDRFELVAAKGLDLSQLKYDVLKEKPWNGAVHVFAQFPEDPEEAARFMNEVFYDGKPDLERRPEYWHPYADHAGDVAAKARNIEHLLEEDDATAAKASHLIEKYQAEHSELGYVPLLGRTSNFSLILDTETGEQLDVVDIDPYQLFIGNQTRP